ncbi:CPBP family intramembrane metalloprotease [bacterium]|nr:CPBP family intramembrane metalloprotease [bacterium]
MIVALQTVILLTLLAILIGGLVSWSLLLRSLIRAKKASNATFRCWLDSLVPFQKRDRPFWSPADFLMAFGLRIITPLLLISLFQTVGWMAAGTINPSDSADSPVQIENQVPISGQDASQKPALAPSTEDAVKDPESIETAGLADTALKNTCVQIGAMLMTIALIIGWLTILKRDAAQRLGLQANPNDWLLSLKGIAVILPAVMLSSSIASYWVDYEHPVLKTLLSQGTPVFWTVTFFATGLLTPVLEEILFRGLLQGSLQGMADRKVDDTAASTGKWRPSAYWPLFVTSFIFAIMHFPNQGAAPIPIFVLSLGLGYLYRQTGSLFAPIAIHIVLNSLTLLNALANA